MHKILLLSPNDIELCKKKNDEQNQLAFAIMLGYFKTYVKFPAINKNEISQKLISQISFELNISIVEITGFEWGERLNKRFRQQIRNYLGYREATNNDSNQFIEYLIKEILPRYPSKALLMEQVRTYFQQNKIEVFKDSQLDRYINSAKNQFEQQFFKSIYENLNADHRYIIDQVLTEVNEDSEDGIIELSELKKDIPGARLKNVSYAIDRINLLSKIKLPATVFSNVESNSSVDKYVQI